MKISELIKELEEALEEYGDKEIVISSYDKLSDRYEHTGLYGDIVPDRKDKVHLS